MPLIAHYPLHGNANDVREGNHGTNNGASATNGILDGQAMDFSKSDSDYISLPSVGIDGGLIAISAFANFDSIDSNNVIVGAIDSSSEQILVIGNSDSTGEIAFSVGNYAGNSLNPTTGTGFNIPTGEWVHISGVANRDTGNAYIYYNGRQVASASGTIDDFTDVDDPYIGAQKSFGSPDSEFNGSIADVRFYNHEVTQQELQYLYGVVYGNSSLVTGWK